MKNKKVRTQIYYDYIYKSRVRNIPFLLTKEYFLELTNSNCFYCGIAPTNIRLNGRFVEVHNGVDRVDNNRGYEVGNVVPCCKYCNSFKSNYSEEKFLEHVKAIAKHQESK